MIGFTGTPIFVENATGNALGKRTTKELFDDCLHKYVIVDAIRDRNVLQFQIDYRGKYTAKGMASNESYDDDVEGIDTKELYDNPLPIPFNFSSCDCCIENTPVKSTR